MPIIKLGDISLVGETRRRVPSWSTAQDNRANEANRFLRQQLPHFKIDMELLRDGTRWIVHRGLENAHIDVGQAFRDKFGKNAVFDVPGGNETEEFFLRFSDAKLTWKIGHGRFVWTLYFFLLILLSGAIIIFRPFWLITFFSRFF